MAAVTTGTEGAAVGVVIFVASDAFLGEVDLVFHRLVVTGMAVQVAVAAGERVVGLAVVIEAPSGPIVGIVATGAVLAQTSVVDAGIVGTVAGGALSGGILEFGAEVAGLTGYRPMQPEQGEGREVVVETHRPQPTIGTVALLAFPALLAAMTVVLLVTCETCPRQFGVQRPPVAGLAGQAPVTPLQGVIGVTLVVEHRTQPGLGEMARATALTEQAVVGVVLPMAGLTVTRQFRLDVIPMTLTARHPVMAAFQWVVGVFVVVEQRARPLRLVVAVLAPRTIGAAVNVVEAMAGNAVGGGVAIARVGMAALAGGGGMGAPQGEIGAGMVEAPGPPAGGGVTGGTVAEPSHVPIVVLVTSVAAAGGLAIGLALTMAFTAGQRSMHPFQGEVAAGMVEGVGIEQNDAGIPSLMIAVTMAAFLFTSGRGSAMESLPCP